jgi:predicted GNAT family N-acyltransferase
MTINQVEVEKIRPLRHLVLRPGQPIESTDYDRDNDNTTLHYATFVDEDVVSIATFYPQNHPEIKAAKAYRLRGMATHPEQRRCGFARALMVEAMTEISRQKGDLIWCKARLVALEFYESLGFVKSGPIYEIEGIGPHFTMYKTI